VQATNTQPQFEVTGDGQGIVSHAGVVHLKGYAWLKPNPTSCPADAYGGSRHPIFTLPVG